VSARRREARERALGLLYEAEARDVAPAAVLDDLPMPPDQYAIDLVVGVGDDQSVIDELIRRFAKDWKLERMPAVDRAVLRMAIHELMSQSDVPTGAVISEAVELAKQYSTEESGRFVNGMLSRIAAEVRPPA
jgi:transcription antitermination protein NusB